FFVSLEHIEAYANGYKAVFDFGNPLAVDFDGGEFRIWWGPKQDLSKLTLEEWNKQTQNKSQSFLTMLRRGSWNRVEAIIAPAMPDQIGSIEIDSITLSKVSMNR